MALYTSAACFPVVPGRFAEVKRTHGLGRWTGKDCVPWSQSPPFGLCGSGVPQFLSFGFDDNGISGLDTDDGGITWVLDLLGRKRNRAGTGNSATFDGAPAKSSFYMTTNYIADWRWESPVLVKRAWHRCLLDGHEIGNHTHSHAHGATLSKQQWSDEIRRCSDWLSKPFEAAETECAPDQSRGIGAEATQIVGFRAPFLECNDNAFAALRQQGFHYDASIEEGWQKSIDGGTFPWPYTLNAGSPGNDDLFRTQIEPVNSRIKSHAGLWALPVHPVIVPPDDQCQRYKVPAGLRQKLYERQGDFDISDGKITGMDYNLWIEFQMTRQEFLATLMYTLDLRLAGNRAPFMFGAHPDMYSKRNRAAMVATPEERRQAFEEFLEYAFSYPQVRVVTNKQVLDWVRNPVSLTS